MLRLPARGRRGRRSGACRRRRRSSPGCAGCRPCREPCASQAVPVASAAAAPPDEPAAERDSVIRVQRRAEDLVEGVGAGAELRRVRLGVDDAAFRLDPLDQDVRARPARNRRRSASPAWCARRRPSVRSLIGTGRPASRPRSPAGRCISASACARARSKHSVGKRVDRAVDRRDARFQRVEQVVRRHRRPQPPSRSTTDNGIRLHPGIRFAHRADAIPHPSSIAVVARSTMSRSREPHRRRHHAAQQPRRARHRNR